MEKGQAKILGVGSFVPEKRLTNQELETLMDTSDEWITSRTGIRERRIASSSETTSSMGIEAAKRALAVSQVSEKEIDLILVATATPDFLIPSTAALIQKGLGILCPAFDLNAACSGFLYALSVAKAYIEAKMYQKILLVGTEKMSAFVDFSDRRTAVLFGDGASAVVIGSKGKGLRIDAVELGADGAESDLIIIPGGGAACPATSATVQEKLHFIQMHGQEVFRHAIRQMASSCREMLGQNGLSLEEIDWVIPHQANARITEAVAKTLDLPIERFISTIQKYGNTSASSIPLALDELFQKEPLSEGQRLLLVAFGGGLTWGAALLTEEEQ